MIQKVEKNCSITANCLRPYKVFRNARTSFLKVLKELHLKKNQKVLLPGYIGWSSREGSGVFDPIAQLGLNYDFYPLDSNLRIDIERLKIILEQKSVAVLVIIHYFGFVDPNARAAIELARHYDSCVIEDEAHSMYSDLIGGACGRDGDFAIFSLHKMLPVTGGGILLSNAPDSELFMRVVQDQFDVRLPHEFDLCTISQIRQRNANHYREVIDGLRDELEPLFTECDARITLQTFPVRLKRPIRDLVYHQMNARGFGVVSLYHTLVNQLPVEKFPQAYELSKNILNLPVHQDIRIEQIDELLRTLSEVIHGL